VGIRINAMTLQVRVADIEQGVAFYQRLIGRAPDLDATPTFKEWQILPDCWLQVTIGDAPMQTRLRFGVDDLEAARGFAQTELKVEATPTERIEGLVAWCNFDDPWGNPIGLFQDLAR
jgi:catechol 2,3-dioxygenase-like lactoylglutathione lyase family enzyme